jgi:hypothetical protein
MEKIDNWDEWAKKHHIKVNYRPKETEQIRQQNRKAQNGRKQNPQANYSYKV